jgi:hypothetical protein
LPKVGKLQILDVLLTGPRDPRYGTDYTVFVFGKIIIGFFSFGTNAIESIEIPSIGVALHKVG